MKTVEDLDALEPGTVIMTLEEGVGFYYLKNEDEEWVSFGGIHVWRPIAVQTNSAGKWAVVEVPVIDG